MCVCVEEEGGDMFVYRGSLSVCVKGAGNVFVHRCQKMYGLGVTERVHVEGERGECVCVYKGVIWCVCGGGSVFTSSSA